MEDLTKVRVLIDSGEKKLAWDLLNQILTVNPKNETAWILACELAKPEVKATLIHRALEFLPNSSLIRNLSNTTADSFTSINKPKTLSERIEAHKRKEQVRIDQLETRYALLWFPLIGLALIAIFAVSDESYIAAIPVSVLFFYILYQQVAIKDELVKAGRINLPDYDPSFRTQTTVNDLNRTTNCRSCHHSVSISATTCPNCGLGYPGLRVQCPKCGSQHTNVLGEQSFNLGRSIGGGVLLGPVGLLAGFAGKKSVEARCSTCNYKWAVKTDNIVIS